MTVQATLQTLFARAVEIEDPAQREAFLAEACGHDAALRREVERLVAAHGAVGGFMDSPAADLAATALLPSLGERPGMTIGPYKLLEQIGEGGMGLVFMAEQSQPLRRRVALKIIKPGLDTRAVIARFEAERQALALMDHPNIARVYDAGATDSGRPYFVMELVRGAPITDYCREQGLDVWRRLELFIDVCQAVQHAHQKGVIHRDLKPTNILVTQNDTAPMPKVIDFGVAKATASQTLTDKTLLTAFTQIIGTPLYMSPEQANLRNQDIDTRSDVYSLGVVLYELLTGATPFDADRLRSGGPDEMRRIIREEVPPKPSTRATTIAAAAAAALVSTMAAKPPTRAAVEVSALCGDLDWIVMKALEKDRRRRYESPGALAADITRHLSNEPVEACPPTRRYRIAKFVRRRRVALSVGAGIAVALLIGVAASLWQAVRATNAERTTAAALKQKDAALQQARQAVDAMYTKVAEDWLAEQGELTVVQRDLLLRAQAFYQDLSMTSSDDLSVQLEALRASDRVGAIQVRMGELAAAMVTYSGAIDRCTALIEQHSSRLEFAVERLTNRVNLARTLWDLDDKSGATIQLAQAVDEESTVDQRQLKDRLLQQRFASALASLSGELTTAGRVIDADTAIKSSLKLWQSLVSDAPDDFACRFGLARAQALAGQQQDWWGGRDEESEAALRIAVAQLSRLHEEYSNDRKVQLTLSKTLNNLGVILARQKRYAEGLELNRRSLELAEGLARRFPDDAGIQKSYAISINNFCSSLEASGQTAAREIDELLHQQLEVLESLVDRHPENISYAVFYLDCLARIVGRGSHNTLAETRALFERADHRLADVARLHAENPTLASALALCLSVQAAWFIESGDHRGANRCLDLYPPAARRFDAAILLPDKTTQSHGGIRVNHHWNCSFLLLTPVELLRQCVDFARADSQLTASERETLIGQYETLAAQFDSEADLAVDAWVQELLTPASSRFFGFQIAFHAEQLVARWIEDDRGGRVPPSLHDAYQSVAAIMYHRLLDEAEPRLRDSTQQHLVSQVISCAPPELRDADLALRLARRSIVVEPKEGNSWYALAAALFRTQDWRKCMDALETRSVLEEAEGDAPHSLRVMTLWKLGQRDAARDEFAGDAERLRKHREETEGKESQGHVVLPSIDMVERLHAEATALLTADGSSPVDPQADDPRSEELQPAARRSLGPRTSCGRALSAPPSP